VKGKRQANGPPTILQQRIGNTMTNQGGGEGTLKGKGLKDEKNKGKIRLKSGERREGGEKKKEGGWH